MKEPIVIDQNAATKNQKLIDALINGESFTVTDNTSDGNSATANNPLNASGNGYTVTLVNGMLKFNSSTGLNNFLAAADSTVSQWDPANDVELQGLPTEKSLAGEPALNSFDATMGFSSLRKEYEMLYYDNPNFKDTIKTRVDNYDYQTVLNKAGEVQIVDTIYKYLSTYFIAKIINADYSALNMLRNAGGKIIIHPNIKYLNPKTKIEYVLPIVQSPQGGCVAAFNQPQVYTDPQDNRRKTISFTITCFENSQLTFGLITGLINWGDGSSTPLNSVPAWVPLSYVHTYNVNPAPGACVSFTISLAGTVIYSPANSCTGITVQPPTPAPVNVCGPSVGCTQENNWIVTNPPLFFTYGGYNYRITGQVGVDNNAGFFGRSIIYGRTYWAKQYGVSNEWYPVTNKKARLGVEIYNKYYTSDCSTINNFYEQYWHFNRSNIIVKYSSGGNLIGWVSDFTNAIRSNHYVRIVEKNGNVVEFTYQNHYLH